MREKLHILYFVIGFTLLLIGNYLFQWRIDLTADKRFTLSTHSQQLMKSVNKHIEAKLYLTGDLNTGFLRLKEATVRLLDDLSHYSKEGIDITFDNPNSAENEEMREAKQREMVRKEMLPTAVYEKDESGKSIRKTVYPWLEISDGSKTVKVNLLKNIQGKSGSENLNISIENLEYELTDAIRRVTQKEVMKIAFLEGHGELSELETYSASKVLSRYFQIDRGEIGDNADILNDYKAIIIAKPTSPFSEKEKYVLDQYLMRGGRMLWLIDGVRVAEKMLSQSGTSPALPLDVNLNDMLFRYGVRINSVLVQDMQCTTIPMNVAPKGEKPHFEAMAWFYAPLLATSTAHSITRNIPVVEAEFCSALEIVGKEDKVKKGYLLATSDNSHIIGTPTDISISQIPKEDYENYFTARYLPTAVALEGHFTSIFAHRTPPKGIRSRFQKLSESATTRQVVVACGNVIRNELNLQNDTTVALPLGIDRITGQQYGNEEFVTNAVLYLTDQKGWLNLRSKHIALRLLNKNLSHKEKTKWQVYNVVAPTLLFLIFGVIFIYFRRKKYRGKRSSV